jgi:S-adenosylmethionine-diacylglycerol 3-amino-3-carboxypropyl transferase
MSLAEQVSRRCFHFVHQHNLVYNACWEDPRLDRQALQLRSDDTVVVITSAGCNALDYLLDAPREVHAVDMNFRQNALLELKVAGIRTLDYATFFDLFGRGRLPNVRDVYSDVLRAKLSETARCYWDRHLDLFAGQGGRSFYFRGTSGRFARFVNLYIDHVAKLRPLIDAVLHAPNLDIQRDLYYDRLKPVFWGRFLRWFVGRDATLSMLGVPPAQRHQVEQDCDGGIAGFIERSLDAVFGGLPLADNYFWRVYLTGRYSPDCCPSYLQPANFQRLRDGLVDRLSIHTGTVEGFLSRHERPITRFVLLDHMDWLAGAGESLLRDEWQAIFDRAAPGAKALWRSGGLRTDFVDDARITDRGRPTRVGDRLTYHTELADRLHAVDRVHTYARFMIADLAA